MSYCTYHNLVVQTDANTLDKIVKYISSSGIMSGLQQINDENIYTFKNGKRLHLIEDSTKWYDRQIDMKKLSTKFKDVLFELYGNGDESEDIWLEYYKNGGMQRCEARIIFDDFNENLIIKG